MKHDLIIWKALDVMVSHGSKNIFPIASSIFYADKNIPFHSLDYINRQLVNRIFFDIFYIA